ncbi:MAG: LuxR family transcriptional regulator [Nocardiopsaceae bacterium]|nr:LuxR family transcriptional regulator [Nocardiopsaceae bacterium]
MVDIPRQSSPLSHEVTKLVGRQAEVADVCRSLTEARLVTIVGAGGVGKTRVALRAARHITGYLTTGYPTTGRYPDGMCFAELSGLRRPELLPDTVAAGLRLTRAETGHQFDAVLDHLRTRRLLLVLDTCEHIIEGCASFAAAVLATAPGVTILATSRQPLDALGERVYHLAPLPVPTAQELPGGILVPAARPTSLAGAGDAAELFAARASAADPSFRVTPGNWADTVRVCRRLDGIPLAIELAAVRLRALPLHELADRLERRFDTLAERRAGTPRHHTLRTAIEWSHDLCTRTEQALWARLSVFAGTFDIATAERVCAGHGLEPDDVLAALVGLAEKSVVTMEGGRYRMLDTIREFGAARLASCGQEAASRGRFVDHYLEAARSFAEHFLDADQMTRLRALRAEHDNLRAAIDYALASDDERTVRRGAELATALHGYWTIAGLPREGRHWLAMALDRLPSGPSAERAWALIVAGYLATYGGEPARAVAETRAGLRMARDLGDAIDSEDRGLLLARAHLYEQMALMFDGRLEEAFAAGAEARPRLEALNDRVGLLFLDAQMGHLHELAFDLESAVEACERCLNRLAEGGPGQEGGPGREAGEGRGGGETRGIGEKWLHGYCLMVAGLALLFMGRNAEATRNFAASLPMAHERGDDVGCGYALEGLGWIAESERRWGRAAWLLGAADARWEQAGARLGHNPIMEDFHRQRMDSVRRGLGDDRFEALFAEGTAHPLDRLVGRATSDADTLTEPPATRPAGTGPAGTGPAGSGPDGPRPCQSLAALTAREREIAGLVAAGLSNREVAERLFISKRTVDSHLEHIFGKLGLTSRVQLTVLELDQADIPGAP